MITTGTKVVHPWSRHLFPRNALLMTTHIQLFFIAICCTESEKTVSTLILKARLTIVGTRISGARHW
jgi:hypothetical protein